MKPTEGTPTDVISLSGGPDSPGAATCAGCGAALAPDQRYCLACGRPCSPVRLAFLDVLQGEPPDSAPQLAGGPGSTGYAPPQEPDGVLGSLRRYSGLLALLGVLLAALLIGLLVGHWISGGTGTSPGKQVVEVKGLSGALGAAPVAAAPPVTAGTPTSGSGDTSTVGANSSHDSSSPKEAKASEAEEVKEVKTAKAPPVTHKAQAGTLQKLSHTTGKQHAQEVNAALGNEPVETGGH